MTLLPTTPHYLKFFYQLTGFVQFSYNESLESLLSRLWCLPFYLYSLYLCFYFNSSDAYSGTGIFFYISIFSNSVNVFSIFTTFWICYTRSTSLRQILSQISQIQVDVKQTSENNWHTFCIIGLLMANIATLLVVNTPKNFITYLYMLPLVINCAINLLIRDVLNLVFCKFESVNYQLGRQVTSKNLKEIFPSTKINRIEVLQDIEVDNDMKLVENLSHIHYNLVKLSFMVCENFEITIIANLILWFEKIIETVYYAVYISINETINNLVVDYVINLLFVAYSFYWLFTLIGHFCRVEREANKTATIVHDIWNKVAVERKFDKRIRHLQLVSVKLLNTKLKFTARNFFTLDWTCCHMVKGKI
ncbi:gustatory receptor 129 [Tribolium castaneum]|uniref:Gustatory receptor n=1 Tax=Tribolium castaneum TaxID=7070 RepID=D6WTL4_TRICA|nr:gustatory receptor 129 [Tribolium castaneum]